MSAMKRPLYFDCNSTTPIDPRVLEAMLPYFTEDYGNPHSAHHSYGWSAKAAVEKARAQVAALIGATVNDIIFTSGSTESLNLAIHGFLENQSSGRHLISSQAEHKATIEAFKLAEKHGHEITLLPVNRFGQVEVDAVRAALRPNTALVSLMHANNEVGSFNSIAEIGALLKEKGDIAFHVDAAQTAGKHPIEVKAMQIDLLSMSAHKFHGPKGVGALYFRRPDIQIGALMGGGGQERGLRGGTQNVPAIVGFGVACEIAMRDMEAECSRQSHLRNRLIEAVVTPKSRVELNGHPTERLCNNVNLSFYTGSDRLLEGLSDIAFSTASACSAGGPSHVLKAMGRDTDDPLHAVARFSFGRFTRNEDIDVLIQRILALTQKGAGVSKA